VSYPKGAKRSHPDKLAKTLAARDHEVIRAALAAPLPTEATLERFDVKRTNQGQSSACTCYSTIGAVAVSLGAAGVPGFVGSMHCLYSASGLLGSGLPLEDDGRQLADVMACLQSGLVPFEGDDSAPELSDVTTANVCELVTPEEQCAEVTHVVGQHTIDLTAPDAIDVACATLVGSPPAEIVVASYVGPGFENSGPADVVEPETPTDPPQPGSGGHAIRIRAYRTNASGKREFQVVNSWGYAWCDKGCVWVSEAWLLACYEAWPMTCVAKFASPDTLPAPDADATSPLPVQT
jgi:hypothetical protein